ncbi:MAG: helix-turn-helix transcriptional regulator [Eggerthellaceae bacterium]|nr:helix-turn-helix transcriptional regulator [Eggerthellaceae bacterium]
MQKPGGSSQANRWLFHATVGLGLCFACMEYERYTALWNFGTRTLSEIIFIMLSLCAVLAVVVAVSQQGGKKLYESKALLAGVGLVQTLGLTERILQFSGVALPSWVISVGPILMQTAGLLFVIYAQYFLDVGVKKSVRAFAWALMMAGAVQIVCAWLPRQIAFALLFSFAPASCVLLATSQKVRSRASLITEQEDLAAERESMGSYSRAFPFWQCCASIAFINVLLLALHDQAMSLQDGGELSLSLQISSGLGSLLAGALFLSILNYLQELEFVELFRTLVLPLVLVALYASAMFGAGAPLLYLVPLGMGYTILLLLIWTLPRCYPRNNMTFVFTCVAFFVYKVGWAAGIVGIMLAPAWCGEGLKSAVIVVAFGVLLVLAALHLMRYLRVFTAALKKSAMPEQSPTVSDEAFRRACENVSRQYSLTSREQEVLPYLAKGRNARHIASALVISDGTARTHIMHIYQKMEIKSQQALMDRVDAELAE